MAAANIQKRIQQTAEHIHRDNIQKLIEQVQDERRSFIEWVTNGNGGLIAGAPEWNKIREYNDALRELIWAFNQEEGAPEK